jgi:hypothetical protein
MCGYSEQISQGLANQFRISDPKQPRKDLLSQIICILRVTDSAI